MSVERFQEDKIKAIQDISGRQRPRELRGSSRFPPSSVRSTLCGLILALTLTVPSVRAETTRTGPPAEVNGEAITAEDLDRALGTKLAQLQEQIYALKRDELEALITQRLLAQEAAKRGMSVAALLDAEITSKVALVTEMEIEAVYQENKTRVSGDEAAVREKVRATLQQQKLASQRKRFVETLRSQGKVVVRLQPPTVARVDVSIDGAPSRGTAEAPVTLVEFSDFHCPFCKRVQATLRQLLERYPGKVRHVYRNFPVDGLHPQARRAAEAARCAQDQGKFWAYHDLLFTHAPQAAPDDLKRYAAQVGLDVTEFDRCLSEGSQQAAVQRDIEEGTRLGVAATPSFFINGRPLAGAKPLDEFVRLIEDELARTPVRGGGGKTDRKE